MTKRELFEKLATVADDAELLVQLPDNEPPVGLSVEVFPETDHTDVVLFPLPPVEGAFWKTDSNINDYWPPREV